MTDLKATLRPTRQLTAKLRASSPPAHQGHQERMRRLRLRAKSVLDSKDPDTINAGQKIIDAVRDTSNPAYASLVLMCSALDVADQTGEKWHICAEIVLAEALRKGAAMPDQSTS